MKTRILEAVRKVNFYILLNSNFLSNSWQREKFQHFQSVLSFEFPILSDFHLKNGIGEELYGHRNEDGEFQGDFFNIKVIKFACPVLRYQANSRDELCKWLNANTGIEQRQKGVFSLRRPTIG